jgi:hypothetical protein
MLVKLCQELFWDTAGLVMPALPRRIDASNECLSADAIDERFFVEELAG